ncbi:MAG TPA: zinc-binding dehydrogenase, partial [Chroococcales cyanobacterium]
SIGVAKAAGAAAIYAIDINDYRLGLASAMGANAVFNSKNVDPVAEIKKLTNGDGVDVIFEMSGNPQAIRQGFEMMRNGGRYSMLGIPSEPMTIDIANAIVFKGATVQGITGRKMFDTWYKTAALLSSGKLDITPMITHRFSLEEFEKGFDLMLSGNCGKVILVP